MSVKSFRLLTSGTSSGLSKSESYESPRAVSLYPRLTRCSVPSRLSQVCEDLAVDSVVGREESPGRVHPESPGRRTTSKERSRGSAGVRTGFPFRIRQRRRSEQR